jgi:hypothetical protein
VTKQGGEGLHIPEQTELLTVLQPLLDELFQEAVNDEGPSQFRSQDLERQRTILRKTFDNFWDKQKEKLENRLPSHGPVDELQKNTLLQFARDYIDQKILNLE